MIARASRPSRKSRSARSGVVLLMVLWTLLLLTILVASFVQSSSTEGLQARHMLNTTRARYAAEAGMHRAVYELGNPVQTERWKGDGRTYEFYVDDAKVSVQLIDETGKIDINQADLRLMTQLFQTAGLDQRSAEGMAARVQDWKDPDDAITQGGAEKAEYAAADLNYGPRNQLFVTVGELQQILGMSYELYTQIEPMLTINAGIGLPNLAFAQADVMAIVLAQQGATVTPEQIAAIIALRQSSPVGVPIPLPNGGSIMPGFGGATYSVKSLAELPSGATASLEATVQLGQGTVGLRPFRIARWREGQSN